MSMVKTSVIPTPLLVVCRLVRLGRPAGQPAHLARELVQPVEARGILAESRRLVDCDAAGIVTRLADAAVHERAAGHDHVVADRQMAGDADLPGEHAARADRSAAGDPGAARDHRMRTDAHVVADLD